MPNVHVIWYRYSDGSGAGVTRVYRDKDRAEADLVMLKEHAFVTYELAEVPIVEEI